MEQITKMLKRVTNLTYGMAEELKKDPVRPNITPSKRIGRNKDVFYEMSNEGEIDAVVCVAYSEEVPKSESELFNLAGNNKIAIFYTIWSNKAGAGRKIIFDTVDVITNENKNIQRFVTLSPDTKIAERFHLRNGAVIYKVNEETINYEYSVPA
jgi:hypothetical protein